MRWIRKAFALVYVALCFFPLALLLGGEVVGPLPLMIGAGLHAAYFLAMEGLFPKRFRAIALVSALALAGLESLLLPFGLYNPLLSVPLLALSLVMTGVSTGMGNRIMTFQRLSLGAGLYVLGYVVGFLSGRRELLPALGLAFGIYLVFAVLLLNVGATTDVAGRGGSPAPLRGGNIALAVGFAVFAAALCNIGLLRDAFAAVTRAMGRFFAWMASLSDMGAPVEPDDMLPGHGPAAEAAASTIPPWLYVVMEIVGLLTIAAILCVLLFYLARLCRRLYRLLRRWMGRDLAQREDFSDEQVSLMSLRGVRATLAENLARAVRRLTYRQPRWGALDNREKVRFALEQLLYRRAKDAPDLTLTAREAIGRAKLDADVLCGFAGAYERARYSTQEIGEGDAEAARRAIEGM